MRKEPRVIADTLHGPVVYQEADDPAPAQDGQYEVLMRQVWVTTSFVACHCWPDAPDRRAYLAHPHRHRFGVRAQVSVSHDDREVEFHDLLEHVNDQCAVWQRVKNLGAMSCEMMSESIARSMALRWPQRIYDVTVDEDGECGATVRLAYDDIPF